MLSDLKTAVFEAHREIARRGLVGDTWGNASGVDRERGLVVIKPSGVSYDVMRPKDMVVVSIETGALVDGHRRPSSDTATHLEIYRAFAEIGGVVHTHSLYATAWAQAAREIPALGTTHADHFDGPVPCTRRLRAAEIRGDYERNTGRVIVERVRRRNPLLVPAILVVHHGPFAWGRTVADAVQSADAVEQVARLAAITLRLAPRTRPISPELIHKHFSRKHGETAYYGQVDRGRS